MTYTLLNSIYDGLEESCNDEFINKNRGYGYTLKFDEFKEYVAKKFEGKELPDNLNDTYYEFKDQLDRPMYTSLDIENKLINNINRG